MKIYHFDTETLCPGFVITVVAGDLESAEAIRDEARREFYPHPLRWEVTVQEIKQGSVVVCHHG